MGRFMDRISDWLTPGMIRMSGAERTEWMLAASLQDVADLTARWLSGDLKSQPGYNGPVDVDEDIAPGMTTALIAANRAGFLTTGSQAAAVGFGFHQVAAVDGYADRDTWQRLLQAANNTGLVVDATGRGQTVTWHNGRPYTSFGRLRKTRDLRDAWTGYGVCHPFAVADLLTALPVVVYDPEPGRNDRLWPMLHTFAGGAS